MLKISQKLRLFKVSTLEPEPFRSLTLIASNVDLKTVDSVL
jgi:hypothetical protein